MWQYEGQLESWSKNWRALRLPLGGVEVLDRAASGECSGLYG